MCKVDVLMQNVLAFANEVPSILEHARVCTHVEQRPDAQYLCNIQYTLLAVNIYMFVATNVGVAGDTIKNIYISTYYTEEKIDTYFTLKHLYA
jgi:hypothetical protein